MNVGTASRDLLGQMTCTSTVLTTVMILRFISVENAAKALDQWLHSNSTFLLTDARDRPSSVRIVIKYFPAHHPSVNMFELTKVKIRMNVTRPSPIYHSSGSTRTRTNVDHHVSVHTATSFSENLRSIFVPTMVSDRISVHTVKRHLQKK